MRCRRAIGRRVGPRVDRGARAACATARSRAPTRRADQPPSASAGADGAVPRTTPIADRALRRRRSATATPQIARAIALRIPAFAYATGPSATGHDASP